MNARSEKTRDNSVASARRTKSSRPRDSKKTAEDLTAAFLKLKNSGEKITAHAVAAEIGVDPSLIPKAYPRIHRMIETARGRGRAQKAEKKASQLEDVQQVLAETRGALEALEQQMVDLVSENLTLSEQVKEQAKKLVERPNDGELRTIMQERDSLAADNRDLKVWIAELHAQREGKLIGRIGRPAPQQKRKTEGPDEEKSELKKNS